MLDAPRGEVGKRAALTVTPASVSFGVRRNSVHAMCIVQRSEANGLVPGLQSVDTAIGTLCRRSASIGGRRVSRRL